MKADQTATPHQPARFAHHKAIVYCRVFLLQQQCTKLPFPVCLGFIYCFCLSGMLSGLSPVALPLAFVGVYCLALIIISIGYSRVIGRLFLEERE